MIVKHAETDWRTAAWMLERRNPARYGRNVQRVDMTVREEPEGRRGISLRDVLEVARDAGIDLED